MEHRSDGISADGQERPPRSPPLLVELRCVGVSTGDYDRPSHSAGPFASGSAGGDDGPPLPSASGPLEGFDACKRRRLLRVSSLAAAAAPAGPPPLLQLRGDRRSLPPLPLPAGSAASAGRHAAGAARQPPLVQRVAPLEIYMGAEMHWQQRGASAAAAAALPHSPHGSDSSEESSMPGHTRQQQQGFQRGVEKAAGQRGSGAAPHTQRGSGAAGSPKRTSARRLAESESEWLIEEELAVQALLALTGSA